jgi:hypothetical protein
MQQDDDVFDEIFADFKDVSVKEPAKRTRKEKTEKKQTKKRLHLTEDHLQNHSTATSDAVIQNITEIARKNQEFVNNPAMRATVAEITKQGIVIDKEIQEELEKLYTEHDVETKNLNLSMQKTKEEIERSHNALRAIQIELSAAKALQKSQEEVDKRAMTTALPVISFSTVQKTLIPAGKHVVKGTTLMAPACNKKDSCMGLSVLITMDPGLGKRHTLMSWMSADELSLWTKTGIAPMESRPCFLCDFARMYKCICIERQVKPEVVKPHYQRYRLVTGVSDGFRVNALDSSKATDVNNFTLLFAVPIIHCNLIYWKQGQFSPYLDVSAFEVKPEGTHSKAQDPTVALNTSLM